MTNVNESFSGLSRIGPRWEPTVWLQSASALVGLLVAYQVDWLTAEQAALVIAAVSAIFSAVNALMVRPIIPAAFTGAVAAVAALLGAYGLDFSQEQVGAIQAVVIAALTLVTRNGVIPTVKLGR